MDGPNDQRMIQDLLLFSVQGLTSSEGVLRLFVFVHHSHPWVSSIHPKSKRNDIPSNSVRANFTQHVIHESWSKEESAASSLQTVKEARRRWESRVE